jgi:hypothetical protein
LDKFQELKRFQRLVSAFIYGFEDFRFFRKVDKCMWMLRVLGRNRNERVIRMSETIHEKGTYFLEKLDGTPYCGTFAGNRLKPFYLQTQIEFHVFTGRIPLYGGTKGMRMKKILKTGKINWRFREISSSLLLFRSVPNDINHISQRLSFNPYFNPYFNPHLNIAHLSGTYSGHALACSIRKVYRTAVTTYTVSCRLHFFHSIIPLGLPQLLLVLVPFLMP